MVNAGKRQLCSLACAKRRKGAYERRYNATQRPRKQWDRSRRVCLQCGAKFSPRHAVQVYCQRTCADRAKRTRERATGSRHSNIHRHRARKFGRKYVAIKPLTIYERDRWVCQICKKRVPKDKKSPHPLSPTLDHVIPMSCEGGDHVPENVRLAHFECNWKRGTGGTDQLALIG